VELVASSLTAAVYVGRLSDSMRRRNEQLAMVADISATVSSSLEPREVYRLVVEKLGQYFRVGAGSLLLKDEATDELIFTVTIENSSERLSGMRLPPSVGIAGHVARTQQIYITNDAQKDSLFYHQVSQQIGVYCENLLAVPMVVKGNTIGMIELLNKHDGAFTIDEGERLSAVASIIGVAIENARLFEFVSRRRDRLELLLDQAKQGLSEAQLVAFLTRELELEELLLGSLFMNPYIVGGPVREPEMCFGRSRLLMDILGVLHQNSVLLHGERRIGKTTILRQIELLLLSAADSQFCFKLIYIDLEGIEEQAFFHQLMESIVDSFGKPARGLRLAYRPRRMAYTGREFQRDLRAVIAELCGPQPDGRSSASRRSATR
jgi:transcriptional regulator with GAF, ATPase, and Fis domain